MKNSKTKKLPVCLAVGAFALAAAGIGLLDRNVTIASAAPAKGAVTLTQKDYFGNDVEITVEFDGSQYILADYTRNIYVYDGSIENAEYMSNHLDQYSPYSSTDGVFDDGIAVSIFHNLVTAYDFYTEANIGFDWRGINGKNDEIAGNANLRYGLEFPIYVFTHDNYIYNGISARYNANFGYYEDLMASFVFVGDGFEGNGFEGNGAPARTLSHQGASLDIIAHEYQHGITGFLSHGLDYWEDSGALDEAFSDIFGLLVEGQQKDLSPDTEEFWSFGEDGTAAGDAFRGFVNPPYYYQYSNRYQGREDNGGVHYNSMIASYIQYAACKKLPGYFTRERITKLWLETLMTLPTNADFLDFQETFRTAAITLEFSAEAQKAISDAFDESGFPKLYRVTFQDEDGTVMQDSFVREGTATMAPSTTKAKDGTYRYEFKGWDKDINTITEDTVVTASYDKIRYYTVEFVDDDGNLLKSQDVDEGKSATAPSKPTKASTAQYQYTFKGWIGDFTNVRENLRIVAEFEQVDRTYTVTYVVNGERTSTTVKYGTAFNEVPEGYEGWFTDEACTKRLGATSVTDHITLYAKKIDTDDNNGNNGNNGNGNGSDTQDPPVQTPPKDDKDGPSVGLWVGIGVGAVVIIGAAVVTVLFLKKKKNNQ